MGDFFLGYEVYEQYQSEDWYMTKGSIEEEGGEQQELFEI